MFSYGIYEDKVNTLDSFQSLDTRYIGWRLATNGVSKYHILITHLLVSTQRLPRLFCLIISTVYLANEPTPLCQEILSLKLRWEKNRHITRLAADISFCHRPNLFHARFSTKRALHLANQKYNAIDDFDGPNILTHPWLGNYGDEKKLILMPMFMLFIKLPVLHHSR